MFSHFRERALSSALIALPILGLWGLYGLGFDTRVPITLVLCGLGTGLVVEWVLKVREKQQVVLGILGTSLILTGITGFVAVLWTVGAWATWYLWVIAVGTDTAGYLVGSWLGGPKLCPRISPNKTWTGALGALLLAPVFGLAAAPFWCSHNNIVWSVVFCVFAQLGDMLESFSKRRLGIKDMGTLLPGHGGLLDRADSWIAVGIAALFLRFGDVLKEGCPLSFFGF